jgi:sulfopyruvate decarboxylase TPP-binding subunit
MSWSDTFVQTLKHNDVRFVTYVPDNVLTPLIMGVTSDNYFISVNATREDGRDAAAARSRTGAQPLHESARHPVAAARLKRR